VITVNLCSFKNSRAIVFACYTRFIYLYCPLPLSRSHNFLKVEFSQAYQWSRPIPTSLKVIHSRVYAQAITLGALGAVASIEIYAQNKGLGKKDEE